MKPYKTYVLMLAKVFPMGHPKAGQPTGFKEKFLKGEKIHSVRGNLKLWVKRFISISAGKACLSVREWSGAPYRSKQNEIARLTNKDHIGFQCLSFSTFTQGGITIIGDFYINDSEVEDYYLEDLAYNDGLSDYDFEDWMTADKTKDLTQPLALIHLTAFRY